MTVQVTNAEAIFIAALDRPTPEERAAYAASACAGDAALLARVRDLLSCHDASRGPLDAPPAGVAGTICAAPLAEGPGSQIGPYKLLQQIGEGGMGTVYMAEQSHPVQRKVAIKVIKPGMDSGQVIARFEAERQALALMDHPNIAKVLDGGTTQSSPHAPREESSPLAEREGCIGRPYFVMELVKGVPITQYCDENHLPPKARLELFTQVCQAVQHAHHKGVIHRDLKPSNVLVALYDDKPVPKVIDFGVAKATGGRLTERTMLTGYGQIVGTLEYMSPEQARLNALDVDTRGDIYSLGVLLYELLTGSTPFDKQRLREAAFDEMLRMIREDEPPKPSTRLSTSEGRASIAANRGMEPNKLSGLVRGELDWIVMKALEKDRNRRYETANGFAADVHRYLADEPVQACPPSAGYRLRKFVRRNKGPVLVGSVVFLVLLAGFVGTTLGLIEARGQRDGAEAARKDAVQAQKNESEQRQLAQTNEQQALVAAEAERRAKESAEAKEAEIKAVLQFVENKIFAAARPEGQEGGLGHDVQLRRAVKAALPFVDESFTNQPLIEARLRTTLGISFSYLGEAKTAAEQFERARMIRTKHMGPDHADTLGSMHGLAKSYADLGRHDDALKLYEETLALRKARLGPDHPDTLRSMNNLANSYGALGRHADALKLREETLALQKAKLGPNHRDTLTSMNNLANSYAAFGRHADALKLREETLALQKAKLGPDHPDTLGSMHNVASSYKRLGRNAESIKLREETLALRQAKLGPDHPDTLLTMNLLAWLLATAPEPKLRDPAKAVTLARKAVELAPNAAFQNTLGVAYYRAGEWKPAIEAIGKSMELNNGGNSFDWFFLAMAHWQLGEQDEARTWFDKAALWMEKNEPDDEGLRRFRAEAEELLKLDKTTR